MSGEPGSSIKTNSGDFTYRAFADFLVCSLILHFFCINFIN